MTRLALVVLLALGLAACGSSKPSTRPEQPPIDLRGKSAVEIDARSNLFTPQRIVISPGTKVTWVNKDAVAHNVKATTDMIDFGGTFGVDVAKFGPGASYSFVFDKTGQFPYLCTIHGLMTGNIQVDATASGATTTVP